MCQICNEKNFFYLCLRLSTKLGYRDSAVVHHHFFYRYLGEDLLQSVSLVVVIAIVDSFVSSCYCILVTSIIVLILMGITRNVGLRNRNVYKSFKTITEYSITRKLKTGPKKPALNCSTTIEVFSEPQVQQNLAEEDDLPKYISISAKTRPFVKPVPRKRSKMSVFKRIKKRIRIRIPSF